MDGPHLTGLPECSISTVIIIVSRNLRDGMLVHVVGRAVAIAVCAPELWMTGRYSDSAPGTPCQDIFIVLHDNVQPTPTNTKLRHALDEFRLQLRCRQPLGQLGV